jgi:hypothetical protein
MLRFFALILFVFASVVSYSQAAQAHEPTSATDGGVKLHTTKKSRFLRSSKARKTERIGDAVKDSKYRAEARPTERYVKSSRSRSEIRGTERHGGEARKLRKGRKSSAGESKVFRKHGASSTSSLERKSKVRRSLGRSTQ